jgi:hypothetical protein
VTVGTVGAFVADAVGGTGVTVGTVDGVGGTWVAVGTTDGAGEAWGVDGAAGRAVGCSAVTLDIRLGVRLASHSPPAAATITTAAIATTSVRVRWARMR